MDTLPQLFKRFEGYVGGMLDTTYRHYESGNYNRFIASLNMDIYIYLSDETITDDEYAELQGIITQIHNKIFNIPTND